MTREEAIDVLEKMKYPQKVNKNGFVISNVDIENEALEMAIKALSQEPCDAISREAVISKMREYFHDEYYQRTSIQECREDFIEDVLTELPSVTQKSGKWIERQNIERSDLETAVNLRWKYECSECGYEVRQKWHYCPNCGCRMESEDKEWRTKKQ